MTLRERLRICWPCPYRSYENVGMACPELGINSLHKAVLCKHPSYGIYSGGYEIWHGMVCPKCGREDRC